MEQSAKPTRQNRTITVDFQEPSTYVQLMNDGKAFVECVFAFLLSLGFQLTHKATCTGGGCLTRHSHYARIRLGGLTIWRIHLSLSRLNHWLPWGQAHPEVVQGTADGHHQITDACFPQADAVFHDAAAFDTAVDMLHPYPTSMQGPLGPLLLSCQLLAARFLGGHEDLDRGQREGQAAQLLQQPTA